MIFSCLLQGTYPVWSFARLCRAASLLLRNALRNHLVLAPCPSIACQNHMEGSFYVYISSGWWHPCFSMTLLVVAVTLLCGYSLAQGDNSDGTLMHPVEKEAFYDVVGALNSEWDWRTLYPDPCGVNSLQGTSCDQWGGYWYFTVLSFGPVYDNSPSCSGNATIHPSVAKLAHLRSLSFYMCFSEENTTIPPELGTLGFSLESLTFRYNRALQGEIPAELGDLVNLKRLVLTENNLEGSIPPELGKLNKLLQLDLSCNKLRDGVPESLSWLNGLVVLDLSNNQLRGSISSSLGALRHLQKLDMSSNFLSGAIPETLGRMESLKFIDLSCNNLEGGLPQSLSKMVNLQELYLNGNSFGGTLPDFWGDLTNLMSLDLSSSRFNGSVPKSLGALANIRFLSLKNNRFTGSIPNSLGRLRNIYSLHLDGNALSGPIPFPLGFMQRLGRNLQLGSNAGLCSPTEVQADISTGLGPCSGIILADSMGGSSAPQAAAACPTQSVVGRVHFYALSAVLLLVALAAQIV